MPTYSVFSKSTGRIDRVINCPSEFAQAQLYGPHEDFLDGEIDALKNYVANGQVVAMPPKPSEHHRFDFTTKQWFDPRTPEAEWPLVRRQRDALLLACDWTQLPDVPLATKEAWAAYRQALRDVTLQPDPFNIVWPVAPVQS